MTPQNQSHNVTDGQSVCKSWCRAKCIYYCLTVTVLFFWGALFDDRTGLSFVYVAGPCQRSLSWVRVPYCLRFETFLFVASYDSQSYGLTILVLVIEPQHGPHRKRIFHYCLFSRCWGNVSTELFPINGYYTVACLHSRYLAMGPYGTIITSSLSSQTFRLYCFFNSI
jgi:hypothetical protein